MGGIGSGKHFMQQTMETARRIDIRWLKKHSKLDREHKSTLSWNRNGKENGLIGYTMKLDRMILNFRTQPNAHADWVSIEQTIYLEQTPCNFGGMRKWFVCPKCYSRVAVLAQRGNYFLCRKCNRLPYRSTLESDTDRIYTKKHELGAAIFEDYKNGDGWRKKKGMHQKTFDNKLREYRRLERMISFQASTYIEKLNKAVFR